MGDVSMKLDIIFSLAFFPFDSVSHPPSASASASASHFSSTPNHRPCSTTSPLPKEKSKWEEKQKSLESELMELHETVASLQSRLRRAELQGMEAQVWWYWCGAGVASGVVPQDPALALRPILVYSAISSICSAQLPSAVSDSLAGSTP